MCCWEFKPRYFCAWCRIPLFWHPQPGRLEPCLSSRATGGGAIARCVEARVTPVESERVYKGCCADCARLLARRSIPAYYKDVGLPPEEEQEEEEKPAGYYSSSGGDGNKNKKRDKKKKRHLRFLKERCVIL